MTQIQKFQNDDTIASVAYSIRYIEQTFEEIEIKANSLNNDIRDLKEEISRMKETILTRHDDIRREITPKINSISEQFQAISKEALNQNQQAIQSLRNVKKFNQQYQQDLMTIGSKLTTIQRKVGSN